MKTPVFQLAAALALAAAGSPAPARADGPAAPAPTLAPPAPLLKPENAWTGLTTCHWTFDFSAVPLLDAEGKARLARLTLPAQLLLEPIGPRAREALPIPPPRAVPVLPSFAALSKVDLGAGGSIYLVTLGNASRPLFAGRASDLGGGNFGASGVLGGALHVRGEVLSTTYVPGGIPELRVSTVVSLPLASVQLAHGIALSPLVQQEAVVNTDLLSSYYFNLAGGAGLRLGVADSGHAIVRGFHMDVGGGPAAGNRPATSSATPYLDWHLGFDWQ